MRLKGRLVIGRNNNDQQFILLGRIIDVAFKIMTRICKDEICYIKIK